jgi:hypothetical protein
VKLTSLLLLVAVAALLFCGIQVGGVYWRKYRLDDTIARDLSLAGQLTDQAIHQRILEHIAEMDLPITARDVRFTTVASPRALRVSISYTETVNLLITEMEFPMSLDIERPF